MFIDYYEILDIENHRLTAFKQTRKEQMFSTFY